MSSLDPYKDFVTLTGEISSMLRTLENLMEQHSIAHEGAHYLFAKRIKRIQHAWDQLPYPHVTSNNNKCFV